MLSQHYVQQRSVVFIVDSSFDSEWYRKKANQYIHEQFAKLDSQDYFGFIKLSKNFKQDQLKLEVKEKNTRLKDIFLTQIDNMHQSRPGAHIDEKKRL